MNCYQNIASVVCVCLFSLLMGCSQKTMLPTMQEERTIPSLSAILPPTETRVLELLSVEDVKVLLRELRPERQALASWQAMQPAVEASLAFVSQFPSGKQAVQTSLLNISYGQLTEALQTLQDILPRLDAEPHLLAENFAWVRMTPDFGYTGYYAPTLEASRTRTDVYCYPVYALPKEQALQRATRHQIDRQAVLRGNGLELAWLRDPFDVFTVQVQGSGKLAYADGSVSYLLYAGNNGWPYVAIGRIMHERGMLDASDINMESIRTRLAEYPQKQAAIYDANPRYVYFKLADTPPVGSMQAVLMPWVSVATDKRRVPLGAIAFMQCALPDKHGNYTKAFAGLMLAQDSGYAIKGNRVDIFCDSSQEGKHIASYLNTTGAVVMLLPKNMLLPASIRVVGKKD